MNKNNVVFWIDLKTKRWGLIERWMSVSEAKSMVESLNQESMEWQGSPERLHISCNKTSFPSLMASHGIMSEEEAQGIVDNIPA